MVNAPSFMPLLSLGLGEILWQRVIFSAVGFTPMFQGAEVTSAAAIRGGNRKLKVIIIVIMTTFWSFGFHPGLWLSNIAQEIIPPFKKDPKTLQISRGQVK